VARTIRARRGRRRSGGHALGLLPDAAEAHQIDLPHPF
jgi:hypothetical protein